MLETLQQQMREEFENKVASGDIIDSEENEISQEIFAFLNTIIATAYHAGRREMGEEVAKMPAFENLAQHQGQLDEDGNCVAVSRQALDEVMNAIRSLLPTNPTP